LRHRERRRHADVLEDALLVVEAEQERADRIAARLVKAKARDDAIRRAHVLDLDHRALARLVVLVLALRDDAVESRAFEALEPTERRRAIARRRRDVERRLRVLEQRLEHVAALALRASHEVLAAEGEQIER